MEKLIKKITALLLAAVIVAGASPISAFDGFANLFSVTAHAENRAGTCGESLTYSIDTGGVITISGTGNMTDFEVATQVPWKDYRSSIKSAVINQGVSSIGNFAFKFCSELKSVQIPASVTRIGMDAFGSCSALENVVLDGTSRLQTIDTAAFDGCNSLLAFDFPLSVRTIGYYAFRDCIKLTDIKLPNGLEEVVDRAFFNCSGLSTVSIPATLTNLGANVFLNCDGITSFTVAQGNTAYSSDDFGTLFNADKTQLINYPSNNARTSYSIPDTVATIDSLAFLDAVNLESVYIPAGTVKIGDSAFAGCSALEFFSVNGGNTNYYADASGVLLGRNNQTLVSFPAGSSTESYVVNDRITTISAYAFYKCANLKSVTIPKSVASIGSFALGFYSDIPTYYQDDEVPHYIDIYEDFSINCYMDTAANRYAENNGIAFNLLDQVWNGSAAARFEGGSGSQQDPYIIMTGGQLYLMAGIINGDITQYGGETVTYDMFNNKCYKLGADINLNYINEWEKWFAETDAVIPANSWKPIGGFFGEFDGNGHTINGVFVNSASDNQGLFSAVVGGKISNLGLYKCYFKGGTNVGAIAGELSGGTVQNCYAYSYVTASNANAGGIVGKNSEGEVARCYSGGYVNSVFDCAGGVVGLNNRIIFKSFSTAEVKGRNNVGGVSGNNTGNLAMCYNAGVALGNSAASVGVGGVSGVSSGTVSRCYYLFSAADGGINGADVSGQAEVLYDAQLRSQDSFVSWDFTNDWTMQGNSSYNYPEIAGCDYLLPLPKTFSLEVSILSESGHGTVTPLGDNIVIAGSTVTCRIIPNEGYSVSSITVDGIAVDAASSYTFENIDANHRLNVVFEVNCYDAYFYPGDGVAFEGKEAGEPVVVSTPYGSLPLAPTAPELENYQFDGWDPELAPMTTAGASYTATYVLSHIHDFTFSSETVNATCTKDGKIINRCRCGETKVEVIPAAGHVWEETYTIDKPATCIFSGSKSIHCSVCGAIDEASKSTINPTGHEWSTEYTVDIKPTCTQAGSQARYCIHEGCKECNYRRTVPALGHSYPEENYVVSVTATCTTAGRETCMCANGCGEISERTIPATGHSYGDWLVTREATCASDGEQQRSCSKCGDVQTRVIPKAHSPEAEYTVDIEPTCVYAGSKSLHCEACGERTGVTAIPATGHNFGQWITVREAASSTRGMKKRVCSDCGYTQIEFTSTLAASFSVAGVPAVIYSGKAQCPVLTVKNSSGVVLSEGTDYFVEYYNNVNAGTATAVVTGMGSNYGSVSVEFTVSPADINTAVSIAPVPACVATGLPLHPGILMKLGSTVVLEKDGYTLSYANNINSRSGSVIINGIRNFTGTKTVSFDIISGSAQFTVDAVEPMAYTGSVLTPPVTVRDAVSGKVLSPQTDYSVTYANNINVGSAYATAVVTGNGAYSGTQTAYFVIIPKDIAAATIPQVSGGSFDYIKKTPAFELYDGSKLLTLNSDYYVGYINNLAAGEAKAIVKGTGSYCGSLEIPFTIAKACISDASVSSADVYYTGSPVKPVLTVRCNGHILREGADYTVSCRNNIEIGTNTASATITGIGCYSGTKGCTFSILNNPVSSITLSQSSISLGYGKTITLTADVQPANATNRKVVWTVSSGSSYINITPSSDTRSCTVKGVGKGMATVTATTEDGGFAASCTVNATMTFFQRIIAFFKSLFGGGNAVMSLFYSRK